jgi:hypothetical protein
VPLVARFDTPGSLRDAPPGSAFYDNWHRRVARLLKDRTPGHNGGEFVDPSVVALQPVCEPTYAWTKVTFTTETPEYWEALAETEPAVLLERYRELVSPDVQPADLFDRADRYIRANVFNHQRGIVHYVMKINGIAPLINAEQDTPIRGRVADNYDAGSSTRCPPRRASWSATSGSVGGRSATAGSWPSTSR